MRIKSVKNVFKHGDSFWVYVMTNLLFDTMLCISVGMKGVVCVAFLL